MGISLKLFANDKFIIQTLESNGISIIKVENIQNPLLVKTLNVFSDESFS
jgi:hypothetical protein